MTAQISDWELPSFTAPSDILGTPESLIKEIQTSYPTSGYEPLINALKKGNPRAVDAAIEFLYGEATWSETLKAL